MLNTPASTRDMPLPVRIFHAAMEQQLPLAGYAQSLGISSESLRAVVTAQPDDVEAAILDRLAEVYHQPRETLPDQLRIAAPQETFAAWLKRNMDGISQHALRTRVQVDAKTLKRFLNAEMLPDSDQAERISRALYIDRREIARVIAADMAHQANADRGVATTSAGAEQGAPSPAVTAEPAMARSRPAQRKNATAHTDVANAGEALAAEAGAAEPALEGERPRRAASRRQAGRKLPDATESGSAPEAGLPQPSATRRRAGPKAAEDRETTTTPVAGAIAQPDDPPAAATDGEALPVAAATDGEALPAAAATDGEALPAAAATDGEAIPAFTAPNQRIARKQRRAGPGFKHGITDAPAPVTIPGVVETPASEAAIELASEPAVAPTLVARPAGLAIEADGATTPAKTRRSAPPAASATAAPPPAPASVAPVLAADTTTLQLTVDEVRLIRHWRQLHPQGRRATLHFIGSLLVED